MFKAYIDKIIKGGIGKMSDFVDVHDLEVEDVKFIEKLVNLLRIKGKEKEENKEKENIVLGSKESQVIGKLTRREIYDHL